MSFTKILSIFFRELIFKIAEVDKNFPEIYRIPYVKFPISSGFSYAFWLLLNK